MDFNSLCQFYISNYAKLKNNKQIKQNLIYSYELLKVKRNKLKLGSILFEIKPTLINGIILTYSFEMIFSRQPSAGNAKKQIEKILTFFNWSWDFKNVVTLIIFLWLIGYYCINSFWVFYQTYISTSLLDDEHLNIVLNQVFTLIETKPINTTFIIHSSNILAELSLYLNLF